MDDPKNLIPIFAVVAGIVILFMLPVLMLLAAVISAVAQSF